MTPLPDSILGTRGDRVIIDDPWSEASALADLERWRNEVMGVRPEMMTGDPSVTTPTQVEARMIAAGYDLGGRDQTAVVLFRQSGGQIAEVLDVITAERSRIAGDLLQRQARTILKERVAHLPDRQKPTRRGRRRARGRGK